MKRWAFAGLILLSANLALAQYREEFWAGYILSADVSSRWSLWQDSHFLSGSFFIARSGLSFRIIPNSTATAGYAYLQTATPFSTSLIRPEHRPWAQIDSRWRINDRTRYSLRLRYDARFRQRTDTNALTSGFLFYNRFRLMNRLHRDIGKSGNWKLSLNFLNEILADLGKQQSSNGIDQIRTFVMFGFNQNEHTLQLGPHWRYLPEADVNRHRVGITLWYIANYNFIRKSG